MTRGITIPLEGTIYIGKPQAAHGWHTEPMKLYPTDLLRIRDKFYLIDQVPAAGGAPRGQINEVRASGPNGQIVHAPVDSPPGTTALLDSRRSSHVYLVSLGIIPAEQLRAHECFVPVGQPAYAGEPYEYLGANAEGLMMGRSPGRPEPIVLNPGDFVQPV